MIFTPDLSSAESVIDAFQGAQAGQPLVPGQIEFIPEGVRIFGSTTNEKYVSWWFNLEPERFPFYEGWKRGSMRYRLRIGEDVPTASAFNGGKWPGLIGTYDLWSESVLPPSPAPSAFATWEARVWYGDWDGETYGTGIYYYGVRGPRAFVGPTTVWSPGAVHVDTPGTPTSVGKFYGSGTQGGIPTASVRIKPGVWYTFEEQVVMNSVKDKTLFIDTLYPNGNEAYEKCLANANEDGILRLLVDDVLVYEATKVAFRGLDKIGIQSGFVNYYDGGRGQYPKFPAPIEFGSLTLSDEVQGGGVEPMPDLPTQEQKDAATANAHAAVDALSALVTVGEPIPPPPVPTIDAFGAAPTTLPPGGGSVELDWLTSNAEVVTLDGEEVQADGQLTDEQDVTTTYTLTASGSAPLVTRSVTVVVQIEESQGELPVPKPLPAPAPPESALAILVNGMPPNSWAELTPQLMQQVICSASQSGNVIPFANAAAYDEFNAEIAVVAADHLVQPRLCIYSLETNRWRARRWFEPTFVHAYQHTVCVGGVHYYRYGADLLADDGSRDWVRCAPMPVNISQVATVALVAWQGKVLLYDGNSGSFLRYDPYTDAWGPTLSGMMPGLAGLYHVVAAATPHGVVYGGGNGGNAPFPNTVLRRLNPDYTSTPMPPAPIGIGIFSQANLVPADDGNVYALGFGQHWRLHPVGGGSWTRLPDPPADLIQPNSGQGFISCTVPGAVAYIDAGYGVAARMRIYKP